MTYHVTLKTREGELVEEIPSLKVEALPVLITRGGRYFVRAGMSEGRALYIAETLVDLR